MKRCIRISAVLLAAVTALTLAVVSPERESWGNGEIPLDDAEVFFELNNTDGDLGIHSLIDGEPWKKLVMEDPYEREILRIRLRGRLKEQGLTELFFERAEPNFGDLDPVDFFLRFPEGESEIEGTTLDGAELEGEAEVTHLLPAPPGNVMINTEDAAEDCDAAPSPQSARRSPSAGRLLRSPIPTWVGPTSRSWWSSTRSLSSRRISGWL